VIPALSMHERCPKCGYPDVNGRHFKGLYTPGMPCANCDHLEAGNVAGMAAGDLDRALKEASKTVRGVAIMAITLLRAIGAHRSVAMNNPNCNRIYEALCSLSKGEELKTKDLGPLSDAELSALRQKYNGFKPR